MILFVKNIEFIFTFTSSEKLKIYDLNILLISENVKSINKWAQVGLQHWKLENLNSKIE